MPLGLTDAELAAIMEAARPIRRVIAISFWRDCAVELAKYEVIGIGVIHRVTSRLQREHLNPPRYRNGVTKWR
jgi:hypothetical protein